MIFTYEVNSKVNTSHVLYSVQERGRYPPILQCHNPPTCTRWNNKYIHSDCMSVHYHSSCKLNAPIKLQTEVHVITTWPFKKLLKVWWWWWWWGGAIGQNFTIHLTYKIYSSAMLYSKGSKSWYTYFQTIIQIYIKRRKLYGQHIWFWAHSFPYMTQGWNYSHMWCDQIVSGLIIK